MASYMMSGVSVVCGVVWCGVKLIIMITQTERWSDQPPPAQRERENIRGLSPPSSRREAGKSRTKMKL